MQREKIQITNAPGIIPLSDLSCVGLPHLSYHWGISTVYVNGLLPGKNLQLHLQYTFHFTMEIYRRNCRKRLTGRGKMHRLGGIKEGVLLLLFFFSKNNKEVQYCKMRINRQFSTQHTIKKPTWCQSTTKKERADIIQRSE